MAVPVVPLIIGGASLVGGVFDFFANKGNRERQAALLDQMIERADRQERVARGEFTTKERTAIEKANEPFLNRVQADLASRGLGRSPAGVKVITKARQEPFTRAQAIAAGVAPAATSAAFQATQSLPQSTFGNDLAEIVGLFTVLRGLDGGLDENDNAALGMFIDQRPNQDGFSPVPGGIPGGIG